MLRGTVLYGFFAKGQSLSFSIRAQVQDPRQNNKRGSKSHLLLSH